MTASTREDRPEAEYEPVYHLYGPHRAGLPPLRSYFREVWRRRAFAVEMSKANMRGDYTTTFFGQAWLILNPLLMAAVYYLLITIIRGQHDPALFTHLTLGLFAFTLVSSAMTSGAGSVVGAGRLLVNTAFPRLLISLAVVRTAFFRFLPTVPVYFAFHILFGNPWHPRMLLALYFVAMLALFSLGAAAFFGALQVHFRDTSSFLPYFVRIWMYVSPILWLPERILHFGPTVSAVVQLNPLYSMLGGYTDLVQEGVYPSATMWVLSAVWAVGVAVLGCLFFISREREFAVHLN